MHVDILFYNVYFIYLDLYSSASFKHCFISLLVAFLYEYIVPSMVMFSGGSSGPVVCSLKPASENHHLSLRILFEFDSSNAMSRLPQMLVINEDEEDIKY